MIQYGFNCPALFVIVERALILSIKERNCASGLMTVVEDSNALSGVGVDDRPPAGCLMPQATTGISIFIAAAREAHGT
jgi:hypothetical protein